MKPSDTEFDTKLNSKINDINLKPKQSNTHIKSTNRDINDIILASLQIRNNTPSTDDDNHNKTTYKKTNTTTPFH